MARSNTVTVDRSELDAFIKSAEQLTRIVLKVGILEGRTRYPRQRKHDAADNARLKKLGAETRGTTRLGTIRKLGKELRQLGKRSGAKAARAAERDIRRSFKALGISSRGLVRRGKGGTPVAKVAGVHQSGSAYHTVAFDRRRPAFRRELDQLQRVLVKGGQIAPLILAMGRRFTAAVRAQIKSEGLVETGLLRSSVDFQIVDRTATAFRTRVNRARRSAARRAKAAKKGRS